jgi:crotonobetainyl-CoA:carnitine CoA-transferase CaiB-like acyl-CoA transferase
MGKPELAEDERFATHHARGEHEDLLDEIIGEYAAAHTAQELDEILNEGGVVCGPVYTAQDVYEDPHFRERGLLVEHEDEVHGRMTVPGVVPKLSETPGGIRRAARWTVGADTETVLEELGVDAAERARLAADGVI